MSTTKTTLLVEKESDLGGQVDSTPSSAAKVDLSKLVDGDLSEIKNDLVRRMAERAKISDVEMYSRHGNVHSNNVS